MSWDSGLDDFEVHAILDACAQLCELFRDLSFDVYGNEPWQQQNPHIDIMMVSKDLMAFDQGRPLNYVFGLASGRVTVQSVALV